MKAYAFALVVLIMSSCHNQSLKSKSSPNEFNEVLKDEYLLMESDVDVAAVNQANAPAGKESLKISMERKLIKNGSLSFETNGISATKIEIEKLCKEFEAYVASETQYSADGRLQHEQEFRIPARNFDAFIKKLEGLGKKIENKNINTQDVTEEFIDVEARLKTKKDVEIRYRELLKLAKTVIEMISIESQIGNVRSEIESMEGRLNYLKNQVGFSTLRVSYYELTGTDFGFASKFGRSFKTGWDNLLVFLIGIMKVWPFFIIAALLILIVMRWRKKGLKEARTI